MGRTFFGTDGIRGPVGRKPMSADFMLQVGHAVGRVLKAHHTGDDHPQVIIGKDTRVSGYMIEAALQAGLISAGVDVALTGPIPTPGVAYLTKTMRYDMGIVISASHNPFSDNGVKFFSADGTKFPDEWEEEIEEILLAIDGPFERVKSLELGKAIRIDDAAGRYIEFCKSTFDKNLSLKGMVIVVDAAHGAAYHTAKSVLHELGAKVICVGCDPDGFNINEGVGATHPEFVASKVLEHKADYGIALDGDADRLMFVDSTGRLFDGDEILYILAKDRMLRMAGTSPVVGTLMTNEGVVQSLAKHDIACIRAKVGDRYVMEELVKRPGCVLGGEGSGHIIDLSKHTTGDGTIAALSVLEVIARRGMPLSQMLFDCEKYPQKLINVKLPHKGYVYDTPAFKKKLASCTSYLEGRGRILIRPSGTEPLIRVMVEHFDQSKADFLAKELAEHIQDEM